MSIQSKIESVLFVSPKPLSLEKIAKTCSVNKEEAGRVLAELEKKYQAGQSGIQLMRDSRKYQLVTDSKNSKIVRDFLKDERTGELTRPALETLTIIAYRGPITKGELELIRGVNCSLILRNLLIKGLVDAEEDKEELVTFYSVTFDFLRFLGINKPSELPDYEKLCRDKRLDDLLASEEERGEVESDPQDVAVNPEAQEGANNSE